MDNQLTQNSVRARADEKRDHASASARAASSVATAKMDAVLAIGVSIAGSVNRVDDESRTLPVQISWTGRGVTDRCLAPGHHARGRPNHDAAAAGPGHDGQPPVDHPGHPKPSG